jgi:hypothetical protein
MADVGFGRGVRRLFPAVNDGKVGGDYGKRVNCCDGPQRKACDD